MFSIAFSYKNFTLAKAKDRINSPCFKPWISVKIVNQMDMNPNTLARELIRITVRNKGQI